VNMRDMYDITSQIESTVFIKNREGPLAVDKIGVTQAIKR